MYATRPRGILIRSKYGCIDAATHKLLDPLEEISSTMRLHFMAVDCYKLLITCSQSSKKLFLSDFGGA